MQTSNQRRAESSFPRLAEIFDVSVDELMQVKTVAKENEEHAGIVQTALKGLALAMGVAVVVLSIMEQIETKAAIGMLGMGLACLAVTQLSKKEN